MFRLQLSVYEIITDIFLYSTVQILPSLIFEKIQITNIVLATGPKAKWFFFFLISK